jgi:heme A synthase
VVPAEFTGYFTAAAAASGVLIGLLFVAVSLRSETVFGDGASAAGRAQAGSAFISLSDCFFVSLVALIPQAGLGVVAIAVSIISLLATVRMHGQVARQELQLVMLALSLVTYLFQLVIGVLLVISHGDHALVYSMAYLEIALFAVALSRAWALVQGKHLQPSSEPEPNRPANPVSRATDAPSLKLANARPRS